MVPCSILSATMTIGPAWAQIVGATGLEPAANGCPTRLSQAIMRVSRAHKRGLGGQNPPARPVAPAFPIRFVVDPSVPDTGGIHLSGHGIATPTSAHSREAGDDRGRDRGQPPSTEREKTSASADARMRTVTPPHPRTGSEPLGVSAGSISRRYSTAGEADERIGRPSWNRLMTATAADTATFASSSETLPGADGWPPWRSCCPCQINRNSAIRTSPDRALLCSRSMGSRQSPCDSI